MRGTLAVLIMNCMALVQGCVSPPGKIDTPSTRISASDLADARSPYPCVSLALVAATPVHLWKDPDDTKYTIFRLRDIQVLRGPGEEMRRASRGGGGIYPLVTWQETCGNLILARGFNPETIGIHGFWDEYNRIQAQEEDYDRDYLTVNNKSSPIWTGLSDGSLGVSLIPLKSDRPELKDNSPLVHHSMLVFILSLKDMWRDLHNRYRDDTDKEAVTIACQAVLEIANCHQQKWPAYKWNRRQQDILDWCKKVAGIE